MGVASTLIFAACQADSTVAPVADAPVLLPPTAAYATFASSTGTTLKLAVNDGVTLKASSSVSRSKTVTWSSTNSTVARVSNTGKVTAVGSGSATITAKSLTGTDNTSISVYSGPYSVAVTPSTLTLAPGAQQQLAASTKSGDGVTLTGHSYSYSSSNLGVATVSSGGVVTAVGSGTANITVNDGSLSKTVPLTVSGIASEPTVTSFVMSPTSASVAAGGTRQFSVATTWSDGAVRSPVVTYSATGGTITVNGLYTAGQIAGTFMVIASCGCGKADTSVVSITSLTSTATLSAIAISPKTPTVAPSATQQFAALGLMSDGSSLVTAVTYSTNGGSVNAAGLYTAPSTPGTYRVIATQVGGTKADTANVSVQAITAATGLVKSDNFSQYAGNAAFQQLLAAKNFYGVDNIDPQLASIDPTVLYNGHQTMRYTFPGGDGSSPQLVVPVPFLRNMWLRVKVRWSPGWTTTGTLTSSANAYKFLSWGWYGLNGRGEITITNTTEYQNLIDVFPPEYGKAGSRASIADYNSAGRIANEWSDGQWYDYIVHYEITGTYTSRQRFWVVKDGGTPVLRATSSVTSYSDVPLPPIDRVQLGRNYNQMRLPNQTMYLWYGQWEVYDGTKNPMPFGLQ
jgi:hypothetical protein